MIEIKVDDEILLRQLEMAHAGDLFALMDGNRAHLREWLAWVDGTKAVADMEAFIQSSLEPSASDYAYQCGIWCRGILVGVIGLHDFKRLDRKAGVGYWLQRDHEGKGIMTRAARAMINHLFKVEKLNRVEIRCAVGNKRSRAIPERLGAREEGVARQVEWLYDHFIDQVIYAILAEEWEG